MKFTRELSIILIVCFLGEVIHRYIASFIPGSVIGMVLLLVFLCVGLIDVKSVEKTSDFLLKNLGFFFVPAAVGLITCLNTISKNIIPILCVIVISSIVVIVTTGLTVQALKKEIKEE